MSGNGKVQKYQGADISVRKQRAYKQYSWDRCLFKLISSVFSLKKKLKFKNTYEMLGSDMYTSTEGRQWSDRERRQSLIGQGERPGIDPYLMTLRRNQLSPTLWSWTSSLQNGEKIYFCSLSWSVVLCDGNPSKLNTDDFSRIKRILPVNLLIIQILKVILRRFWSIQKDSKC